MVLKAFLDEGLCTSCPCKSPLTFSQAFPIHFTVSGRTCERIQIASTYLYIVYWQFREQFEVSHILNTNLSYLTLVLIILSHCFSSFIKAVGVCFIAVCEGTYANVLAFCFLEEIQREFTITFQTQDVQRARRPYSLIEFGMKVELKVYYSYLILRNFPDTNHSHVSYPGPRGFLLPWRDKTRVRKKGREKTSGSRRYESHYHAMIAVNQHHEID